MTAAALALLLAAAARAEPPASAVARAMARVDALVAQENGKDARDVAELDRRAENLFRDVAPLGWRAAAPLGAAARDPKRPAKARLFAVTFLAKLSDPAAFKPLADVLLDPEQDADSRQAAATGVAVLDVPAEAERRVLCAVLEQPGLPRGVSDEALIALTRLGCADPAALDRIARAFGPRPDARDLASALRALAALGSSRGDAPMRRLLALVQYFPPGSSAREAAIWALGRRPEDLVESFEPEAFPVIRDALRSESENPATMATLVRLIDAFGPRSDELLLPLVDHPDAEVVALAAEALARRKDVAGLPTLETVLAGALKDPRFAPQPGRPDPAEMLARIATATEALRRARAAQK